MKSLPAKDAKYGFGRLIDVARTEPVMISKHGRPVVVVMSVEEYERLTQLAERPNKPKGISKDAEPERGGAPG